MAVFLVKEKRVGNFCSNLVAMAIAATESGLGAA
jgi:hypothetical protein